MLLTGGPGAGKSTAVSLFEETLFNYLKDKQIFPIFVSLPAI